jgi:predicted Rossmann fold nucleotide-binding protein DprA/Smf involved in DNA uptake
VESEEDVATLLDGGRLPSSAEPQDPEQTRVLGLLADRVLDVDEVAHEAGIAVARAAFLLMRLELAGSIVSEAGGYRRGGAR